MRMAPSRRRVLLAALGAMGALAGCIGDDDDDDGAGDTPTAAATPTPTPGDQPTVGAEVELLQSSYDPTLVEVNPGEGVEYEVVEGQHSVTHYHEGNDVVHRSPADAEPVDADHAEGTMTVTYEVEGIHTVFCRPHETSGMVHAVVVGDPGDDEPALTEPSEDLPPAMVNELDAIIAEIRDQFDLEPPDGSTTPTPAPDTTPTPESTPPGAGY